MPAKMYPNITLNVGTSGGSFVWDSSSWDDGGVWGYASQVTIPPEHVRSLSVRRGGQRWQYDAGEMVVVLDNRSGNYDPSVHSGDYGDRLRRGVQTYGFIRVGSYDIEIFTGCLVDVKVNPDPFAPTVTWIFEDGLADLGRRMLRAPAGATDTSFQIASDVLDEVDAEYPTVPAGGKSVVRRTDLSAREMLELIAAANAGRFFVNRSGLVELHWRAQEVGKISAMDLNADQVSPWYSVATFTPGFSSVTNTCTAKFRQGRDEVTRTNGPSVQYYGEADVTVDTALAEWADAAALAQFLADYNAQPARGVEAVRCSPATWDVSDALYATQVELGDLVVVNLPDGGDYRGTVERIAWDFDASGVSLSLGLDRYDPAGYGNAEWFVWDSSSWDDGSLWSAF